MKLRDFIDKLNRIAEMHKNDLDDLIVVIETKDGFLVGQNSVPIKDAYTGFDWTKNQIILVPDQDLIRKDVK